MYENYGPYVQSEIDYRRQRITAGARKSRNPRFPRVRRVAVQTTTTR
jgi:hypothetical protein